MVEKKLLPGQERFEARVYEGRLWGVYDRSTASWPISRHGYRLIPQKVTRARAEAVAQALNAGGWKSEPS